MDAIVSLIRDTPIYGIVASALVALLALAILKRLVQIALLVSLIIAIYATFMHTRGAAMPKQTQLQQGAADVANTLSDSIKKEGQKLRGDLAEAVRDGVKEIAREELKKSGLLGDLKQSLH